MQKPPSYLSLSATLPEGLDQGLETRLSMFCFRCSWNSQKLCWIMCRIYRFAMKGNVMAYNEIDRKRDQWWYTEKLPPLKQMKIGWNTFSVQHCNIEVVKVDHSDFCQTTSPELLFRWFDRRRNWTKLLYV